MSDPKDLDPLSEEVIAMAWEDPVFRAELLANPEEIISREAEILFENQPNDLLIFWQKLFG